jgi:hypothetical protein
MTFDSLTFARRLKAAGFSQAQAEARADANCDLVTLELGTKSDLTAVGQSVESDLTATERGLRIMIGVGVAFLGAILRFQ